MNHRAVVNVATGRYVKGQTRLAESLLAQGVHHHVWTDALPQGCPSHSAVPYAFKAFALKWEAEKSLHTTLLWADACILPIKPLGPLFERIERDGYWFSNNGWSNYEWCADSAYPDLFPEAYAAHASAKAVGEAEMPILDDVRIVNRKIPHVVATTFGISLTHPLGKVFLDEYFRLASETKAFCGPWINADHRDVKCKLDPGTRCAPCGPEDVRGHRHDQTAASVIAWRLGFKLTNAPDIFAYRGGEKENTVLVADGGY